MGAVWGGGFLLSLRKLSQHCMKGWGGSGMGRGFLIIFKEASTALHEGVGWERYGEGVSNYLQGSFHSIA